MGKPVADRQASVVNSQQVGRNRNPLAAKKLGHWPLVVGSCLTLLAFAACAAGQTFDGPSQLPLVVPSSLNPENRYGSCAYLGPSQAVGEDACGFRTHHITDNGSAATNGENLQKALNDAGGSIPCGTNGLIIALAPAEYHRLHWTLGYQVGSCEGKWVIVRADVTDQDLPPPGVRIDPSYASVIPKIVGQAPPYAIATYPATVAGHGANHWWLGPGLNITFKEGGPNWTYKLIQLGENGETNANLLPDSIGIDRCWIHGPNATDDAHAAVGLDATNAVLVDSWIDNIHQVTGDSYTFLVFTSPGPFLIDNNHLEGATAEGFLIGGADGQTGLIPSDITITRNHILKPTEYWPGSPQYNGVRSVVKNGWEFKFGQRALVEGNVIDNVWCCYSQYGWGFLLTPKNNNGTIPGNANSVIQDVTVRYNLFRHTLGGFQMAPSIASGGNGYPTHGLRRISIHDNVFSDVSSRYSQRGLGTYADGTGYQWQITTGADILQAIGCSSSSHGCATPSFNGFPISTSSTDSITIDHNTFLQGEISTYGTALVMSINTFWPITNWQFTNNIMWYSKLPGTAPHGIVASGAPTDDSCEAMETMSPGGMWKGNVFVGVPAANQSSYQSRCALPYPGQPALAISSGGGVAASTTIYVRLTYANGRAESRGSSELGGSNWLGVWKPSTNYGTRQSYAQDPDGNLIGLYSGGESGISTSVFPTSGPPDQLVQDGTAVWISKDIGGTLGTIVTPSNPGNYQVTVSLPILDKGPETGWRIYASTSPGKEQRQAVCGDDGTSTGSIPISTTSCTLASIQVGGANVPTKPLGTIMNNNITWVCWPESFAGSNSIGFADFAHEVYTLLPHSQCKGKGTNGSDPGADYDLVTSKTRGVVGRAADQIAGSGTSSRTQAP
jgi:hypothetical protein